MLTPLSVQQSLIKACSPQDYPHYDELKEGSTAAKRITDKINEAQRRAENSLTVENLSARVDDWKGHHVSHFGDLLLDDVFTVTKSEVDREYHVFLFERIILCCKEDLGLGKDKRSKSNSILKKPQTPVIPQTPNPAGGNTKKTTPLILKGRIYLNNVTDAKSNVAAGSYSLNIWWKGDDDLEYFTLRCRNEEQVRQWETSVKRLIDRLAMKRASERSVSRLAGQLAAQTPRTSISMSMPDRERSNSVVPSLPPHPYAAAQAAPQRNTYHQPQHPYMAAGAPGEPQISVNTNMGYGQNGYPQQDGFEPDDEYEDYPSPLVGSGRATPMDLASSRRGTAPNLESLGYAPPSEQRAPRAHTEDASGAMYRQWQAQYPGGHGPHHGHPAAMVPGLPAGPRMTAGSRMNSAQSFASDSSFGPGVRHSSSRPQLRQQISQSRLRQDQQQERAAAPSPAPSQYQAHHQSMPSRSRSASQPSAYIPKHPGQAPPLPQTDWRGMGIERGGSSAGTKRSSGSSHSTGTGDESYSPGGSSPITPFGSSESSLSQGPGTRGSYEHHATARGPMMGRDNAPVKVKVHFGTDIFVVQVPRSTEYAELVEKVGKKIRLCGPRRDDGPLRVKYEDEEGDLVSMRSSEDVEMAFAARTQVVLHVQ